MRVQSNTRIKDAYLIQTKATPYLQIGDLMFPLTLLIKPDLQYNTMLGQDWLMHYQINILYSRQQIIFNRFTDVK